VIILNRDNLKQMTNDLAPVAEATEPLGSGSQLDGGI
tara:strand:+ start:471 stop:581 length:111 start_codon:yes stop_codon:yes gene_type:complete